MEKGILEFPPKSEWDIPPTEGFKSGNRVKGPYKHSFPSYLGGSKDESDEKLIAGGATLVFDEKGGTRLEVTAEQLKEILAEWEREVTRLPHSEDDIERLRKYIAELENPNRKRGGAEKDLFTGDPVGAASMEQFDRAILKEVLRRVLEAKDNKEKKGEN